MESEKKKKQQLPKWFKGALYKEGEVVTNPFSKEEYKLTNVELSLYDFIIESLVTLVPRIIIPSVKLCILLAAPIDHL